MDRIPIFPLDVVVFPGELFGLHMFEDRYVLMAEEALAEGLPIGVVLARLGQPADRIEHEPEDVGTAVEIVDHERIGDRFLLQTVGARRFRIRRLLARKPYQEAEVEWLDEPEGRPGRAQDLARDLLARLRELHEDAAADALALEDPVLVSYVVAMSLRADPRVKQRLLASPDAEARLREAVRLLRP